MKYLIVPGSRPAAAPAESHRSVDFILDFIRQPLRNKTDRSNKKESRAIRRTLDNSGDSLKREKLSSTKGHRPSLILHSNL